MRLLVQHKKYYAIAIAVETFFVFVMFIAGARSYCNMALDDGVKFSAMDGFFIAPVSYINFIIPLIVLLCNFIIFKDDFDAIRISRYSGKVQLFNQQLVIMFVQCFFLTIVGMSAKMLGTYLYTGTWTNLTGFDSAYYLEFTRITGELPPKFNWVKSVILSVIINSSGTFIRVAVGLLIYWITNYQPITFLALFAAKGKFSRMLKYFHMYSLRFERGAFYTELVDKDRIIESLATVVFVLTLTEIIAIFILPKKNFLKN